MKKIELHCHLDGSLNVNYINKLLGSNHTKELKVTKPVNLTKYLEKFALPIKLLQEKSQIEKFCYLLTYDLVKDDVIYAEIRFCPLFHNTILSSREVIDTVIRGLNKNKKIKTNVILCMMRQFPFEKNKEIIDLAIMYKGKGVCAIDLAGDESKYPTIEYKELFDYAKKNNIPYTIHAGESSDYHSIDAAISFDTKRIGHGINCLNNSKTIKKLIDNNITLEICPTSNINTGLYEKNKCPIKDLLNKGINITINTDNRTVSNTTLTKEYNYLKKYFQITDDELYKMNINAINASFLDEENKKKLLDFYCK